MRALILIAAALTSVAIVIAITTASPPPPPDPPVKEEPATEKVTIGKEVFHLEIAADAASRATGLSGRTKIKPDGGMIFIYPDAKQRSYWMIDCLVDIDIIFLDPRGRILAMHSMKKEPPQREDETRWEYEDRLPSYSSRGRTQFALEFKAGTLKRLKLRRGQIIKLDYERLVKLTQRGSEVRID